MPTQHIRRATKDLPTQQREAAFKPGSFNEADNTVEVVISAGARVRRHDFWTGTRYDEELVIDADAVDLSRIEQGTCHVLDNHAIYGGVDAVLGVVTRAWIEDGQLIGTLQLSRSDRHASVVQNVRDGVLRALSVGYTTQRYEVTEADARTDGGSGELWRATRWTPNEVSFVTVPADPAAATRSASATATPAAPSRHPCEFITRGAATPTPKEASMPAENQAPANVTSATPPADDQNRAAPRQAEAQQPVAQAPAGEDVSARAAEIADLCARHNLPHLTADMLRRRIDVNTAKSEILTALAARDAQFGTQQNTRIETVRDETQTRLRGMEDAMLARLEPGTTLDDNARQYRGLTLLDMGRDHLERAGVQTRGMDRIELARSMLSYRSAGMLSTSDFGVLFNNVAARRLGRAYTDFPATYTQWARRGTDFTDFKPVEVIGMSGGPELLLVNEHGEYKYGDFSGHSESYKLATYGRIVAFTRQAIINDDLRVLDRGLGLFGTSARRLENQLVYNQLTANGKASDGKALFHADHKNLLTGAASALTLDALKAARQAMRTQRSSDGTPLNVSPRYLIVPAALETEAYQLTSNAYTPVTASEVNDFAATGRTPLVVVVEPLLDDASETAWYLAADTAVIDTVEYAYLEGATGPYTETRTGFEVDGTEVKCRLDFAAKALDWRGLVKANGA